MCQLAGVCRGKCHGAEDAVISRVHFTGMYNGATKPCHSSHSHGKYPPNHVDNFSRSELFVGRGLRLTERKFQQLSPNSALPQCSKRLAKPLSLSTPQCNGARSHQDATTRLLEGMVHDAVCRTHTIQ